MASTLVALATTIAVPLVFIVVAFSGCEVRKRSEKAACRAGDVQRCLEVATYYADKADGIIGFAMSNSDTALTYYLRACKLKSPAGCDGTLKMYREGESARNRTGATEVADALIDACAEGIDGSRKDLEAFMSEGAWVANRSASAFKRRCDGGSAHACYLVGNMASSNLGGLHNTFEEVLPAYDQACAANEADSCERAKIYRDEQAKRNAKP